MTPEKIHEEREALAYIKDVKEMIITDARALYAMKGLTNRLATLDVLTSTRGGAYRATLIFYPDLTDSKQWILLYEGCQCKDLCQAMKMLWDAMQTALGDWKAMLNGPMVSSPTTQSPWSYATVTPSTQTASSHETPAEIVESVEQPVQAASA